jgi:hypothetical protein
MHDLTVAERSVVDSIGEFLDAIETTPMTKSFKMVVLQAMLPRSTADRLASRN